MQLHLSYPDKTNPKFIAEFLSCSKKFPCAVPRNLIVMRTKHNMRRSRLQLQDIFMKQAYCNLCTWLLGKAHRPLHWRPAVARFTIDLCGVPHVWMPMASERYLIIVPQKKSHGQALCRQPKIANLAGYGVFIFVPEAIANFGARL